MRSLRLSMCRGRLGKKLVRVLFVLFPLISVTSSAYADEVIVIGALLPLTGDLGYVGEDIRRGIELGLDEVNPQGAKLKMIYEDTRHQTKDAVSGARKLLDVEHVDILISLWDMSDPVAPIAEQKRVPHLCIRWNPHIAEKFEYTSTFETTYISYVASQIKLLKALGVKSVALATEEAQGWILAAAEFRKRAGDAGIEVFAEEQYPADTKDYRSIVTKLLAKNPDMIVTNAFQPGLDLLIKKIREQRPAQRITGYFETYNPLSFVESMPFVAQNDVSVSFREIFKSKYGEEFKARAPHGYDLIRMISAIYEKAGRKLSGKEFIDRFAKIKNYSGATGVLSANATKNIENEPVWMIVKDGKILPYNINQP